MGVRRRIGGLVAIAAAVALVACSPAASGHPAPAPAPSGGTPSVATSRDPLGPPPPAAYAGGACLLVDYDVIKAALGVDFNVSAAADTSGTYSCVVQNTAAELPDLVLSITATDLSPTEFLNDVQPKGAKAVPKLGLVGYEIPIGGTAPAVEVGWLSGNNRLMVLHYAFPAGTPTADVTAMLTKMADLAHQVDATTV